MASRAAVLGAPNGGELRPCGIPLFSLCMYRPTMYLQMKKQLSIVARICKICFCYSFEKFQVYNDQFQAQGPGMQEPGDGSNYMHLYLRISNHAPSNLECLLEMKGRPKFDALN